MRDARVTDDHARTVMGNLLAAEYVVEDKAGAEGVAREQLQFLEEEKSDFSAGGRDAIEDAIVAFLTVGLSSEKPDLPQGVEVFASLILEEHGRNHILFRNPNNREELILFRQEIDSSRPNIVFPSFMILNLPHTMRVTALFVAGETGQGYIVLKYSNDPAEFIIFRRAASAKSDISMVHYLTSYREEQERLRAFSQEDTPSPAPVAEENREYRSPGDPCTFEELHATPISESSLSGFDPEV